MPFTTRSNALGVLAGTLSATLGAWGRYRDWWWYDNLAHGLAGLSLGSLVATRDSPVGQDLAIVGCLTLAWELHEYHGGIRPWTDSGRSDRAAEDTLLDSILVVGAAYAAAKWAKGE